MGFGRNARLDMLVVAAALAGCGAASLSGGLAAYGHVRPALQQGERPAPPREVRTIGMMMAEHAPV